MDMIKLYAMADARSVRLDMVICLRKNFITSYKGTPSNPGKINFLLLCVKYFTGNGFDMMRFVFANGREMIL